MRTSTLCERVQNTMNNIHAPIDIGRIPIKIETEDSQQSTSIPLSVYMEIADDDLECWRHFSLACRILSHNTQLHTQLQNMTLMWLMHSFFRMEVITPNMHMHCHLKSVLLDYGPVFAFWLFVNPGTSNSAGQYFTSIQAT